MMPVQQLRMLVIHNLLRMRFIRGQIACRRFHVMVIWAGILGWATKHVFRRQARPSEAVLPLYCREGNIHGTNATASNTNEFSCLRRIAIGDRYSVSVDVRHVVRCVRRHRRVVEIGRCTR